MHSIERKLADEQVAVAEVEASGAAHLIVLVLALVSERPMPGEHVLLAGEEELDGAHGIAQARRHVPLALGNLTHASAVLHAVDKVALVFIAALVDEHASAVLDPNRAGVRPHGTVVLELVAGAEAVDGKQAHTRLAIVDPLAHLALATRLDEHTVAVLLAVSEAAVVAITRMPQYRAVAGALAVQVRPLAVVDVTVGEVHASDAAQTSAGAHLAHIGVAVAEPEATDTSHLTVAPLANVLGDARAAHDHRRLLAVEERARTLHHRVGEPVAHVERRRRIARAVAVLLAVVVEGALELVAVLVVDEAAAALTALDRRHVAHVARLDAAAQLFDLIKAFSVIVVVFII